MRIINFTDSKEHAWRLNVPFSAYEVRLLKTILTALKAIITLPDKLSVSHRQGALHSMASKLEFELLSWLTMYSPVLSEIAAYNVEHSAEGWQGQKGLTINGIKLK